MQVFAITGRPPLRPTLWLVLSVIVISAAACSHGRADQKVTGPAAAVQTTTYYGKGVVKATDSKRPSIELDHEDIQGLMPAMTMEFYVKDKAMLDGLGAGDRVEFTIENGVGGVKITTLKKL